MMWSDLYTSNGDIEMPNDDGVVVPLKDIDASGPLTRLVTIEKARLSRTVLYQLAIEYRREITVRSSREVFYDLVNAVLHLEAIAVVELATKLVVSVEDIKRWELGTTLPDNAELTDYAERILTIVDEALTKEISKC